MFPHQFDDLLRLHPLPDCLLPDGFDSAVGFYGTFMARSLINRRES
jgi:hypothetical protein